MMNNEELKRVLTAAKDQTELDTILSQRKRKFTPAERAALVLCEASENYPARAIRSKVNGARLYTEKDGKWVEPNFFLPTEAMEARFPTMTFEEIDKLYEETNPLL